MSKARDNVYFRKRLKRDHPTIYEDLEAGRIPNVRQAAAAAGLIHLPTRLDALKREWKKASPAEKRDFVHWLKTTTPRSRRGTPIPAPSHPPLADHDRRLTSSGRARIEAVMAARDIKMGQVMREMGFTALDQSLANALRRPTRITGALVSALEDWLRRHEGR